MFGAKLATGKYDGDGAPTQAITGVGFKPKVVIIYKRINDSPAGVWIKTDKDSAYSWFAKVSAGLCEWKTGYIISLDNDGFTIGNSGDIYTLNDETTASYDYIALG